MVVVQTLLLPHYHCFKPSTLINVPINSHQVLLFLPCLVTVLWVRLNKNSAETPDMCYNISCKGNIVLMTVYVHQESKTADVLCQFIELPTRSELTNICWFKYMIISEYKHYTAVKLYCTIMCVKNILPPKVIPSGFTWFTFFIKTTTTHKYLLTIGQSTF